MSRTASEYLVEAFEKTGANPPLAEAALYVCILASLIAFWL